MKILDLGLTWGGALHHIFEPWEPEVVELPSEDEFGKRSIPSDINLVLFSGGQDVCPDLYGHANVASGCGSKPSLRDLVEQMVWEWAYTKDIPSVGICRGNQFLCAMTGGWLFQDVDGHGGVNHKVELFHDDTREAINTNSTHHQMVVPARGAVVLGATQNRSQRYVFDPRFHGRFKFPPYDPEIILYNNRNLGFQFHPEYYAANHEVPSLVRRYVTKYLLVGRG